MTQLSLSSHYGQTANLRCGLVPVDQLPGKLPLSLEAGCVTADCLTAAIHSKGRESQQWPSRFRTQSGSFRSGEAAPVTGLADS